MEHKFLENVFVTALEGGSNYWYLITDENVDKVRAVVPKEEDLYFSTALYKAVMEKGAVIGINDVENPEDELGELSKEQIEKNLELLANDKSYMWALHAEIEEDGDATSSDVVFQYILFGEVWFA